MFHILLSNGYRELTSNPSTHKDGKNFMILRKPQIFFKEKYDFLKIDLCDRVGDRLTAHLDALAFLAAVERAAAAACLIRRYLAAALDTDPVGHDVAVTRAAHGILGDIELRRK